MYQEYKKKFARKSAEANRAKLPLQDKKAALAECEETIFLNQLLFGDYQVMIEKYKQKMAKRGK